MKDKQKALNLYNNALAFIKTLTAIESNGEITVILDHEYTILHMLASSILAESGEKIDDKDHHKSLICWITTIDVNITPNQAHIFDELRKIRNDINYNGQKNAETLRDFYQRNKKTVRELREVLLNNLKEKKIII
jgi:hypothetical protein